MQDNVLFRFLMTPIDMRSMYWRNGLSSAVVIGVLVLLPIKLACLALALAAVIVFYVPVLIVMSIGALIALAFGRKRAAETMMAGGLVWPVIIWAILGFIAGDGIAW